MNKFQSKLTALLEKASSQTPPESDAAIQRILSPSPGIWHDAPSIGSLIRPGQDIGYLEIIGKKVFLQAPENALGIVRSHGEIDGGNEHNPVGYGDALLELTPPGNFAEQLEQDSQASASQVTNEEGLVIVSPSSGRFYSRPSPDKPPFASVGDIIEKGQTIALLEVMKTFNRIQYQGDEFPDRARVLRVVPADQDDMANGDILLIIEPA